MAIASLLECEVAEGAAQGDGLPAAEIVAQLVLEPVGKRGEEQVIFDLLSANVGHESSEMIDAIVLNGIDFGLPLACFVFICIWMGPKELSRVLGGSSKQV